jgi:hypothetical protein
MNETPFRKIPASYRHWEKIPRDSSNRQSRPHGAVFSFAGLPNRHDRIARNSLKIKDLFISIS